MSQGQKEEEKTDQSKKKMSPVERWPDTQGFAGHYKEFQFCFYSQWEATGGGCSSRKRNNLTYIKSSPHLYTKNFKTMVKDNEKT